MPDSFQQASRLMAAVLTESNISGLAAPPEDYPEVVLQNRASEVSPGDVTAVQRVVYVKSVVSGGGMNPSPRDLNMKSAVVFGFHPRGGV